MAVPEGVSLSYALGLPPGDAISYLESKGAQITFDWKEVWQGAQAKAFTVAGVARLDVLEDIRGALKTALAEGKTDRWFRQTLTPVLRAKGWWGKRVETGADGKSRVIKMGSPARLNLIYRQNMQTAYMAGRYKQMLENADNRPFWQYQAILDQRTRPAHRLLNGRTFRFDDPFWSSHYPPNGWGCRCRVRALSDVGLEREGLAVESGQGSMRTRNVELVDRRTGEATQRQVTGYKVGTGPDAPPDSPVVWTDPGFSYHPGAAAYGLDMEAARRLSLVTDTGLRAQAVQALNGNPARQAAWEKYARGVLDTRRGGTNQVQGQAQVVHFMRGEVAQAVCETGGEPVQVVTASARRLLDTDTAPAREDLLRLPALFNEARAVYWDAEQANLVYLCPSATPGKVMTIIVDTPMLAKNAHGLKELGRFAAVVRAMEVVGADIRPVGKMLWAKG